MQPVKMFLVDRCVFAAGHLSNILMGTSPCSPKRNSGHIMELNFCMKMGVKESLNCAFAALLLDENRNWLELNCKKRSFSENLGGKRAEHVK